MFSRSFRSIFKFATAFLILNLIGVSSQGFMNGGSFWKRHNLLLAFSTSAQTIYPGVCSNPVTIQTRNWQGVATNPGSTLTVNFTITGPGTLYTDANCTVAGSSLSIATFANTGSVYVLASSAGTINIAATAAAYTGTSQNENATTPNPYVWLGGGANANWNNALNWSGGVVPGANNTAVFDSSCTANCSPSLTANTTVGGVQINSGYNGTISQNGFTLSVSNSFGWHQDGGTFAGGSANITISNSFVLTGGTFNSTSATLSVGSGTGSVYSVSGGTFVAGTGTTNIGAASVTAGAGDYNNVGLNSSNNMNVLDTINVKGNLSINSGSANSLGGGGTVKVYKNLTVLGKGWIAPSTGAVSTVIEMDGAVNQTIDASGATQGNLPDLVINSGTNTVSFVGTLILSGNYTVTSGTVSAGTSTVNFKNASSAGAYSITAGSFVYNNVTFAGNSSNYTQVGTLNVDGTLSLADSFNGGTGRTGGAISARGNITITGYGMRGNTPIQVEGTSGTQTIDASGATTGYMPGLTINSSSTVALVGTIVLTKDYTYTAATALTPGTSTLVLNGTGTRSATFGSVSYKNVTFTSNTVNILSSLTATGAVVLNSTVTVNMPNPGGAYSMAVTGNLSLTAGSKLYMYGGTLTYGSLTNSGTITP